MRSTQTVLAGFRPAISESLAFSDPPWQPILVTPNGAAVPAARQAYAEPHVERTGSPVEIEHYIVPGTGGHGRARADALLAIIDTFGCRTALFGYNAARGDTFLIMTSTRPVLDTLGLLLPDVAAGMERAAHQAATAYAAEARVAMPDQTSAARWRMLVRPYFREHLRGYGQGVAEEIRAYRAEATEAGGPELAAVLAEDAARIEERFTREFPEKKPLRKEHIEHRRARDEGVQAGRTARISDGYLAIHDLVFAAL
jgi:hypothetical protein